MERMGVEKLPDAESRCPEHGGGKEVRKTDIAMGDCIERPRKSERRMEKTSNRHTAHRECSERKVANCVII